jgi:hypothetical protein
VYPENNWEIRPKLCLGWEQTMETNLSTHQRAVQKNVDNSKQIRLSICKDLHTSNRIYFERETPNWVTPSTTIIRKEGLYLRCQWSQASGAVEGRCSGEVTRCRQTWIGAWILRLGNDGLFSANRRNKIPSIEKFDRTSPTL